MTPTSKTMAALAFLIATSATPLLADTPPAGVTEQQIKSAKTPEDHRAIADAYAKEAEALRAQALTHRHMDSWYSEPGYRANKLGLVRHCRGLMQQLEAAAKDADALAAAHRAMAEQAAKTK